MSLTLQVLFALPLPPFSFLPPYGETLPAPGCRVVVPWQGGVRIGLVVAHGEGAAGASLELREAVAALDTQPFVTPAGLEMLRLVSEHTLSPPGVVLANLLPIGLNVPLTHLVRALPGVTGIELSGDHWTDAETLPSGKLDVWRRQGLLRERVLERVPQVRVLRALKGCDDGLGGARQANQARALETLLEREWAESAAALAREAEVPESAVRALVTKGYAAYAYIDAPPPSLPSYEGGVPPNPPPVPLPDGPRLGISGGLRWSRLAALLPLLCRDVRAGGSVLVLVPEGALLEETATVLATRLPVRVMNGELSDAQRLRLWEEVQGGPPVVLVASFLGLLVPLPDLARVVVLEEGNASYKLQSGSRLFVPTAVALLAEASGASMTVTDALLTPETVHAFPERAHHLLSTPAMRVHVTDMNGSSNWPLSADLVRTLGQVAERERQAVLLAPRRGFSAAFGCFDCGETVGCPNCDLPLRYHRERYRLRCHQCGFERGLPKTCENCRGTELHPMRGAGTQWIAKEVGALFPSLPVYRYDGDRRDNLTPLLEGEPGALVATTAVFRHPPLPNVSLVGVTLLDTFLTFGDFRAEEEAYRALLNLAELAPRRRPLLLLQTFQPEHSVLRALTDPEGAGARFLEELLERRRRFSYPPYSVMAKVQVSERLEGAAARTAAWLADAIRTGGATENELLGPSPAPVVRVRNRYAYQLFLRAESRERLAALLEPARAYHGSARVRVDVDPRDLTGFVE